MNLGLMQDKLNFIARDRARQLFILFKTSPSIC